MNIKGGIIIFKNKTEKEAKEEILQLVKEYADKLMEIVSDNDTKAGTYEFIDKTAIQIIKRSKIKTVIVNGNTPENVKTAITQPIGTLITE